MDFSLHFVILQTLRSAATYFYILIENNANYEEWGLYHSSYRIASFFMTALKNVSALISNFGWFFGVFIELSTYGFEVIKFLNIL